MPNLSFCFGLDFVSNALHIRNGKNIRHGFHYCFKFTFRQLVQIVFTAGVVPSGQRFFPGLIFLFGCNRGLLFCVFAAFFVTLFPKPRRLVAILTDAAGGCPKVEAERYCRKDKHAKDVEKDVCRIHFENLGYVLGGLSVWKVKGFPQCGQRAGRAEVCRSEVWQTIRVPAVGGKGERAGALALRGLSLFWPGRSPAIRTAEW